MSPRLLPLLAACVLIGQGCFTPATTIPLEEIDASLGIAPDGLVAFEQGFGKLPGVAPTSPRAAASHPSLVLDTELPSIPPDVTVLREWNTAPQTNLLRNVTTAVQVPSGALGNGSEGEALSVTWHDAEGLLWTYTAPAHTLTVTSPKQVTPIGSLGEEADRATQTALEVAQSFLSSHGIDMAGWGGPDVQLQPNDAWRVTFAASRDAQPIHRADGSTVLAGDLSGVGRAITTGTLELPRSLDRSNYPSLTPGEILPRLRTGGTNPVADAAPGSTVSIDTFSLVLYRHDATADGTHRVFYIPAILATGSLREGSTFSPYATLVPLATDESFLKTP